MVMGKRDDVETASAPIAAVAMVGLGQQLVNALVRVPFRRPWSGPSTVAHNVGEATTRQVVRSFMGYSSSLPIEEFRSIEVVLDDLCRVVLPPFVRGLGVDMRADTLAGVPGLRYRRRDREPVGTIVYLHGGGYIGTSPTMYAAFTGWIAHETGCEVFVADYRLAPEFPYPAGRDDALAIVRQLLDDGLDATRLFIAGDSGGGGLASSVLLAMHEEELPQPAGLILFSPEVDLVLDEPSVTENASNDILPWNIPVAAYAHGVDPSTLSPVLGDCSHYPPTFVAFGDLEMFRDPIRRFVTGLEEGGVETTVVEAPNMFHVFPILMPWATSSRRTYHEVGAFVAERLAAGGEGGAAEAVPAVNG
jgi:epsilon-lactone hydrolase